jgi:hypothetical protein
MEVKVSLVIQSNLDDAMIEMSFNPTLAHERLSFIKYLIHHYSDIQTKITVDLVYKQFKNYSITNHQLYKLKNNQYEVNVYKQGSGTNTTIYIVNKKGSTAGIYINAYTAEEAIEGYKNFMK